MGVWVLDGKESRRAEVVGASAGRHPPRAAPARCLDILDRIGWVLIYLACGQSLFVTTAGSVLIRQASGPATRQSRSKHAQRVTALPSFGPSVAGSRHASGITFSAQAVLDAKKRQNFFLHSNCHIESLDACIEH
jgi:hypothetical protein